MKITSRRHVICTVRHTYNAYNAQWRNDGVAAASRDGGPSVVRGPPTVSQFLIDFNVCICCYCAKNVVYHAS